MIVLSDAPNLSPSSATLANLCALYDDLQLSAEIARCLGFPVYFIPSVTPDSSREDILFHLPPQHPETQGIWLGQPSILSRYTTLYQAALQRGIHLLNTPAEHQQIQAFDQVYPKLHPLTPASVIVTDPEQGKEAIAQLGLPIFVRGVLQSRKVQGWQACVAETHEQLQQLIARELAVCPLHPKRAILRRLVRLRCDRITSTGFPQGREFRIILYRDHVLTYGYRWKADDPLRLLLSITEESEMLAIAHRAARQLHIPYVAVDIGQQEDGQWIVIKTTDPQITNLAQLPLIQFWTALRLLA